MKYQPNRNYASNDDIQTPEQLAKEIVEHFKPSGTILEPCCGNGAFLRHLPPHTHWCEIKRGRDFFQWTQPVDWIITNPPWSQIRPFLQHSMKMANHIVFLITINHLWTRARLRDIHQAGFSIQEICILPTPQSFPKLGFQLGAIYLARTTRKPPYPIVLSKLRPSPIASTTQPLANVMATV